VIDCYKLSKPSDQILYVVVVEWNSMIRRMLNFALHA
jgi:hypothetical protein